MKSRILLLVATFVAFASIIIIATGCNTIVANGTKRDGTNLVSTVNIKATRWLWSTEAYSANVEGFGSLSASKSSVDSQAIGAAAEGVARGLVTSLKP